MTAALGADSLELLERALGYTRGALATVTDRDLCRPTPCARWDLGALLAHMDDALDAFTEGASGQIEPDPRLPVAVRVGRLQSKACGLLGAWAASVTPPSAAVGRTRLASDVVVLAAALEITVHGWDVGRATGRGAPLPTSLARALLPVAVALVAPADRGVRFAPATTDTPPDDVAERLLNFLGREVSGPVRLDPLVHKTSRRPAS